MNTKSRKLIYFDNATTSLRLPSTIERLLKSYSDTGWLKEKERYLCSLIDKLYGWLKVSSQQITLVPSSTYAVNEIFESLIRDWGDQRLKAYVSEGEHISNLASLWNFKERHKELIEIKHYSLDKEVVKGLRDEKGIILITLRDNLGNCNWTREELLRLNQNNRELVIIGDFTQSMMTDDISEIKEYFDYFYFSAHKVLGPFGLGCVVTPKHNGRLETHYSCGLNWRSVYVWEQEFEEILEALKGYRKKALRLVSYWIENFPTNLGFSYIHYPNSLIFLVEVKEHSIHDFAYLLEEQGFVFRFNDLCSSNALLEKQAIMRFSLSSLNRVEEIEKLFKAMRYFQKTIVGLK